jgi:hypothetical protein
LSEIVEPAEGPDLAERFPGAERVAEAATGRTSGLFRRQALRDQPIAAHLEVKGDLVVEIAGESPAPPESSQAQPEG